MRGATASGPHPQVGAEHRGCEAQQSRARPLVPLEAMLELRQFNNCWTRRGRPSCCLRIADSDGEAAWAAATLTDITWFLRRLMTAAVQKMRRHAATQS